MCQTEADTTVNLWPEKRKEYFVPGRLIGGGGGGGVRPWRGVRSDNYAGEMIRDGR